MYLGPKVSSFTAFGFGGPLWLSRPGVPPSCLLPWVPLWFIRRDRWWRPCQMWLSLAISVWLSLLTGILQMLYEVPAGQKNHWKVMMKQSKLGFVLFVFVYSCNDSLGIIFLGSQNPPPPNSNSESFTIWNTFNFRVPPCFLFYLFQNKEHPLSFQSILNIFHYSCSSICSEIFFSLSAWRAPSP